MRPTASPRWPIVLPERDDGTMVRSNEPAAGCSCTGSSTVTARFSVLKHLPMS
jgi:hypothetical protein